VSHVVPFLIGVAIALAMFAYEHRRRDE